MQVLLCLRCQQGQQARLSPRPDLDCKPCSDSAPWRPLHTRAGIPVEAPSDAGLLCHHVPAAVL